MSVGQVSRLAVKLVAEAVLNVLSCIVHHELEDEEKPRS